MTDRFTYDAAPYVLGALSPDDRHAFEEHLAGCEACTAAVREFAGLPGLLSRLPAAEVQAVLDDERPTPPPLPPALLARVRQERRSRRWRAVAVGAAAACIAAAGTGVVVGVANRSPATAPAPAVAFLHTNPEVPASAEATLTDLPDGTRIAMTCRYSGQLDGRIRQYALRVVPKAGGEQTLASWPVLSSHDYGLDVVTPLPRDRIDRIEVVGTSGTALLTLQP